ncbi:MAG: hypothetical protein Q8P95_02815 [bacterium]|nr:hypothetical protein [bacterium]
MAMKLVNSKAEETDVLIVVTHLEYVNAFPPYFAREKLGIALEAIAIEKGEAWIIDCEGRTRVLIEPN